ncbi:MAG: hypothetical protein MN733_37585, partial [Nitrososphaera sp.]|nr:hypothetical protein [Nitrososphaera sp.]
WNRDRSTIASLLLTRNTNMPMDTIRVVRATQDEDASTLGLLGTVYLWGVTARNSGTGTSSVLVANTTSGAASDIVADIAANTGDGTNYEEFYGVMYAQPIKCGTGISIDVTNADVVMLHVQGGD